MQKVHRYVRSSSLKGRDYESISELQDGWVVSWCDDLEKSHGAGVRREHEGLRELAVFVAQRHPYLLNLRTIRRKWDKEGFDLLIRACRLNGFSHLEVIE